MIFIKWALTIIAPIKLIRSVVKPHAEDYRREENDTQTNERTVTILKRGVNYVVVLKPPSVVCHHSGWTGSRSKQKRGEEPEVPMLQRVRDAIYDIDTRGISRAQMPKKRKVNLVHRLDRGTSGALLFGFADDKDDEIGNNSTTALIEAMTNAASMKTYVALVRGEGILHDDDFKLKGWFEVSRAIRDENGREKNATTWFNFVAGQPETCEDGLDRPRMSLVLARPMQGRWHQVRKHLRGLSHPILGDTSHGASKVNRQWKEKRNLPGERICLHLARLQVPATESNPEGIDVSAPIYDDMLEMLRVYAPNVLQQSLPVLNDEGIVFESKESYEVGRYTIAEGVDHDVEVDILAEGEHFVIVNKPASIMVHNSDGTGVRQWSKETPMLQRVRDTTRRRVNLINRLDRGASGCLVFSFAHKTDSPNDDASCRVTKALIGSMQHPESSKTYLALCDGDGTWNGVDLGAKGWFTINRPVRDESGRLIENCRTDIRFISSMVLPPSEDVRDDDNFEGRKISIVLARPKTGRWHQIRQHLASGFIGHAIIGDSTHGKSRVNKIWKTERGLKNERTCLHLYRVELPPTEFTPSIDVVCPLPLDLTRILNHLPDLLERSRPILIMEGVQI